MWIRNYGHLTIFFLLFWSLSWSSLSAAELASPGSGIELTKRSEKLSELKTIFEKLKAESAKQRRTVTELKNGLTLSNETISRQAERLTTLESLITISEHTIELLQNSLQDLKVDLSESENSLTLVSRSLTNSKEMIRDLEKDIQRELWANRLTWGGAGILLGAAILTIILLLT